MAAEMDAQPNRPSPVGQRPKHNPDRRIRRRFRMALVFSLLFHLSMVTIFNIVIYIPRHDISYYEFRIIQAPITQNTVLQPWKSQSNDALKLSGLPGFRDTLPPIELPTLEFAELNRLRVRQQGAPSRLVQKLFPDRPQDSWERLGAGIGRLRRSLGQWAWGDSSIQTKPGLTNPVKNGSGLEPAPGFTGRLNWHDPNTSRRLLFAPSIEALWDMSSQGGNERLEFVLEIDRRGRVVNVWSPNVDNSGVLEKIQMGLLRYRFEPDEQETLQKREMATLVIQRQGEAE